MNKIINDNPNEITSESQNKRIKEALERGDVLTPIDALRRFGCFRLGARIYDIIKEGLPVKKEWIRLSDGKRVMSYSLKENGAGC